MFTQGPLRVGDQNLPIPHPNTHTTSCITCKGSQQHILVIMQMQDKIYCTSGNSQGTKFFTRKSFALQYCVRLKLPTIVLFNYLLQTILVINFCSVTQLQNILPTKLTNLCLSNFPSIYRFNIPNI